MDQDALLRQKGWNLLLRGPVSIDAGLLGEFEQSCAAHTHEVALSGLALPPIHDTACARASRTFRSLMTSQPETVTGFLSNPFVWIIS